jgi:tetratricopeptide (TPR) repeat protein
MADINKLKKKAADFEAKKQMDKALAVYREMLELYESGQEDPVDIPLYNRVGDLLQASGNVPEAVSIWERAVDHYSDGGFYNLAIALCNKILRQSPGRAVIYYKLGKISAEKGFRTDARENFLEYAGRMQKAGNLDEAFRALTEFADLVPDQDDVRLMLADQLLKANRKDEAIEQFQIAHALMTSDGRTDDAKEVAARLKAIDPSIEPRVDDGETSSKGGGLVFLDLGGSDTVGRRSRSTRGNLTPIAERKWASKATEGLELLEFGLEDPEEKPAAAAAKGAQAGPGKVDDVTASDAGAATAEPAAEAASLADGLVIERSLAEDVAPPASETLLGLESTSLVDPTADAESEVEPEITEPAAEESVAESDPLAPPPLIPLIELPSVADPDLPPATEPPRRSSETPAPRASSPTPVVPPRVSRPTPAAPPRAVSPTPAVPPRTVSPTPAVPPRTVSPTPAVPPRTVSPTPAVPPRTVSPTPVAPTSIPLTPVMPPRAVPPTPAPPARKVPSRPTDDLPLLDEPEVPATAEHKVPPKPRRSGSETPLPETAERRVPIADPQKFGTTNPGVRLSDFGTFGPPDTPAADGTEAVDADALEIISSEDSGIAPFSDTAPDPSLVEVPSGPIFGMPTPPDEEIVETTSARTTSAVLANSVDTLRDQAVASPEDWGLRRQLAEALLDDGQREEGIAELEVALAGYERDGDLDSAASIAEEIVRLAPKVIRHHQKRVEFAFRAADQRRLSEAYVELADALLADGQAAKARVVYQRVLEIAPDDLRAQAALETIADAPVPEPAPPARRSTHMGRSSSTAKPKAAKPASEEEFVSLGDWLREEEAPKSTRMVVEEKEPTGDEQADFNDMLRRFKQGISDNVDDEDHEAHYDLGVAYKEMGLLDEAIGEFQKALRGPSNRVRALEALGQCFVEKAQLPVAATILQRALLEQGVGDDSLVGVLYLLGTISEELHIFPDAKKYYQRVFAVDIQFRDIGARLAAVEKRIT